MQNKEKTCMVLSKEVANSGGSGKLGACMKKVANDYLTVTIRGILNANYDDLCYNILDRLEFKMLD